MLLSEDLLVKIEDAYYDRISVQAKKELELAISEDNRLNEETSLYTKIWKGFDALKGQQQLTRFQQWEQEWLVHDESELIEWYVNDELSVENTEKLDQKYLNKPDFAEKVDTFKSIKGGLDAIQSNDFRAKMNAWQNASNNEHVKTIKPVGLRLSWKRSLAMAASVLLLITASFAWWQHEQVSNASLFASYYQNTALGNDLSGVTAIDDYLQNFAEAHLLLKNKNYTEAIRAFRSLKNQTQPQTWPASERKHYNENVEWNWLLAMLADGQTNDTFYKELESIANNKSHEYQSNAEALQQRLSSFWRFGS